MTQSLMNERAGTSGLNGTSSPIAGRGFTFTQTGRDEPALCSAAGSRPEKKKWYGFCINPYNSLKSMTISLKSTWPFPLKSKPSTGSFAAIQSIWLKKRTTSAKSL
jgi:hypothetical protein